ARRWNVLDEARQTRDRGPGGRVDLESELGREAHRPQHPHRVFAVTGLRVADDPQPAPADIAYAVVIIEHLARARVVIPRVDREVAPRRILVLLAEHVVGQHAAVLVGVGLVLAV